MNNAGRSKIPIHAFSTNSSQTFVEIYLLFEVLKHFVEKKVLYVPRRIYWEGVVL